MSMNCPQCDSELVASAVGLLCPGCGVLHRFYKTGQANQPTGPLEQPAAEAVPSATSSLTDNAKHPFSKRAKARLKRLVVPELPDPQDASHLLESHLRAPSQPPAPALPAAPMPDNHQPPPAPMPHNLPPTSPTVSPAQTHPKPLDHRRPLLIFALMVVLVTVGVGLYFWLGRAAKPTDNSSSPAAEQAAEKAKAGADKAKRDIKRKADIKEISTALEVYKRDTGAYPVGDKIQATYVLSKATPKYISYVNDDPSSTASQRVLYTYRSDGKSYIISAKLENTQDAEAIDGYYIIQSH